MVKDKFKVFKTREPGGTKISEQIRNILLDSENKEMCALTELFLYEASRAQHMQQVVLSKLAEDYIVLCDRFTDSTIAYQSASRNIPKDVVIELNSMASFGRLPDITFIIDIPSNIGLNRNIKSGKKDRLEQEDLKFHSSVRNAYIAMADEVNKFIVNGDRPVKDVNKEIEDIFYFRYRSRTLKNLATASKKYPIW